MKCRRLEITAGLLFTACLAMSVAAEETPPLGTGLTHYYDFEPEYVGEPRDTGAGDNNWTFDVRGRKWDASVTGLVTDTAITLVSKSTNKGFTDAKTPKTDFGRAYSGGGGQYKMRFHGANAPFLCPSGNSWTISFWVMRKTNTDQRRLLVNGTPIVGDDGKDADYSEEKLTAASSENEGFGFYSVKGNKVGVRLSEKTGSGDDARYTAVSILGGNPGWGTAQDKWHNIMLVREDTVLTLYLNGASQGTAALTAGSTIEAPSNSLYTAKKDNGQGPENALDDIAIWNRALTEDERRAVSGGVKPVSELAGAAPGHSGLRPGGRRPNVVIIMADDLGFGDVACNTNATPSFTCNAQTPSIDKLAREGLRFNSGYCTASTCTPTRYSLLTGTYAFRRNGTGIAQPNSPALIRPGTKTIADLMKQAGYATAIIGKWHLGLGEGKPDWNGELKPGPLEIGFDECLLLPTTNDRVPQVLVKDHRVRGLDPNDPSGPLMVTNKVPSPDHYCYVNISTNQAQVDALKMKPTGNHNGTIWNGVPRIGFYTGGENARFKDEDLTSNWVAEAENFIDRNAGTNFFLLLTPHDIHVPRLTDPRFTGKSTMGPRGDMIMEFDWTVSNVLASIEAHGLKTNTLVFVLSDNGPAVADGYHDEAQAKLGGHKASGGFRGGKYSNYEGGTRIPFITYWPGTITPGVSDEIVCSVDIAASLAQLTGARLDPNGFLDSFDVLDAFLGKTNARGRASLILQNNNGACALRENNRRLVKNGNAYELYDLAADPGERTDLAEQNSADVYALTQKLEAMRSAGRTRSNSEDPEPPPAPAPDQQPPPAVPAPTNALSGDCLTHYYDFETTTPGQGRFSIQGQTWYAASSNLQANAAITLQSNGKSIGTPKTKKTNFGNAYSGGGAQSAARFFGSPASFLCPTGEHWTISFWAMRDFSANQNKKQNRLLVNGSDPLTNYTAVALSADPGEGENGFGFYVVDREEQKGKIGIRILEKTGDETTARSLVSSSFVTWGTAQDDWHSIMLVRDGTALTLYVDGDAAKGGTAELTAGSSIDVPANGLHTAIDDTGQGTPNALDDLAIWNRALTADEIAVVSTGTWTVAELLGTAAAQPPQPPPTPPTPPTPPPTPPQPSGDGPLIGDRLTHYYNFDRTMTTTGQGSFDVTGQTWYAASSNLQVNAAITLPSKGDGIGSPKTKPGFGESYDGKTGARFFESQAPFLCPSGECWTISFWIFRPQGNLITQKRALVNGIPLATDKFQETDLTAASSVNEGFGFYVIRGGRIGVRLSEKKDNAYEIRSLASPAAPKLTWGNWHNVILVRNGTALTLYVDGTQADTKNEMTAGSSVEVPSNGGLYTAMKNEAEKNQASALDDLAIWNRALNGSEITEIAKGERPISGLAATSAALPEPEPEIPPGTGPNIVFIMADDLGWNHIGVKKATLWTANKNYVTPNINRLAKSGCCFPYAYAQATCAPTRACLLTGQYPARNGVVSVQLLDAGQPKNPKPADKPYTPQPKANVRFNLWPDSNNITLARAFKKNGYLTAHVGKYHVGNHNNNAATLPENMGFDINIGGSGEGNQGQHDFATNRVGKGGWQFTRKDNDNFALRHFDRFAQPYTEADVDKYKLNWSIMATNTAKYLGDAVGDAAVETIGKLAATNRATGRPFYLQVHPYAVHVPIHSRPDLKAQAEGPDWPPPPPQPSPSFVILLDGHPMPAVQTTEPTKEYMGLISGLDITVGRILDALRDPDGNPETDDGIETNTIVVFTSDNGGEGHLTDAGGTMTNPNLPLKGRKRNHTEGGTRVPFIISWPGHIPADTMSKRIIHSIDVYPTWMDFATTNNWRPDANVHPLDGESFKEYCLHPGATGMRGPVYWYHPRIISNFSGMLFSGVAPYGDAVYRFTYTYKDEKWRLWNLTEDPYEAASDNAAEWSNLPAAEQGVLYTLATNAVHWLWQADSAENAVIRNGTPPPARWDPVYPFDTSTSASNVTTRIVLPPAP